MPPLQNEHARTMHHDGQRSHLGTLVDRLAGDGNGEQIGKRRRLGYRDHPCRDDGPHANLDRRHHRGRCSRL